MESLNSIEYIIRAILILNKYCMNEARYNEVVTRRVVNEEEEMVLMFFPAV